ncbi:MAG: S8 family serine peptidase [bacterium]
MKKFVMILALIAMSGYITLAIAEEEYGQYHADRFLVRLAPSAGNVTLQITDSSWRFGIAELDAICASYDVTHIEKLLPWVEPPSDPAIVDMSRVYTVHIPKESNLHVAIGAFAASRLVEYAEPKFIRRAFYTPNDPDFGLQWGLNSNHTQAEAAYDWCQGDPNVTIFIVDSGMDMDHQDLVGNLWVNPGEDLNGNGVVDPDEENGVDDDQNGFADDFWGWDFVGNDNWANDDIPSWLGGGHGTHCAGIASAVTDNGEGIASLGNRASLVPVRSGWSLFITAPFEGVGYAIATGADVISMSWGGSEYSQTEQDLFNWANQLGILCVAAAGNSGNADPLYPAAYDNVFAVVATSEGDYVASFSSFGNWTDIAAPGENIYSTFLSGGYTTMDGTSMACPFTAGLAGLVKAAYPTFQADEIALTIQLTANDISEQNPGLVGQYGAGRINSFKAMSMLMFDVDLTLTPQNPPVQIPPSGGSFQYDEVIQNNGTTNLTVAIFTKVVLPSGGVFPISMTPNVNLPAGGTVTYHDLNQNIPGRVPAGTYTYVVYVVNADSHRLIALNSFTFDKRAGDSAGEFDEGWLLTGNTEPQVSKTVSLPDGFQILGTFPNPFNPSTTIRFDLPVAAQVQLEVFDVNGRAVGAKQSAACFAHYTTGTHQIPFDGSNLPSGMYIYRLTAGDWQAAGKMVLLK